MASSLPALRQSQPHLHIAGQRCPVCEQPIPNEKAEQVRARMEARDRELTAAANARAAQQFAHEKAQIEANAKTAIEMLTTQIATKEAAARADGAKVAEATMQQKLTALEQAKAASDAAAKERIAVAEAAKTAAEIEAKAVKESHEAVMNGRLKEQREALEKDKAAAILADQAKTFAERQKLQSTVQNLQRQLERERADVLGEGAELDLYEDLRAVFEDDRIRRVPKGTPGADIVHEIVHKGTVCGKIVYDSKNRNDWKSGYVTKLCDDKIAEGAQHAILSTLKFPQGAKQLDVRDGVILANPARVTAVAEILREHIVQTHALRLSTQEREKKKGALYAYITSERFGQHLDSIETQTDKLLDLDVDEQKAHRTIWEKRGRLLKGVQKAHGNLCADVGRIIGTDEPGK
jgi:hypothetical protein